MALQECRLNLDRKLKELRPHGTLEFPCAGYSSYYTGRQEDSIPWHWHEEIEMVYVAKGRLELKIPSESFYVETGDAFVINSMCSTMRSLRIIVNCILWCFILRLF